MIEDFDNMLGTDGQSDGSRAAFHARAATAVRNKILRTYNLDKARLALPDDLVAEELSQTGYFFCSSDKWKQTLAAAMKSSGLADTAAPGIEKAARAIIHRYIECFHLQQLTAEAQVRKRDSETDGYYNDSYTRKSLADIYTNHLSNQAEAELRQAGLDRRSAHLTYGVLVGQAVPTYHAYLNDCVQRGMPEPSILGVSVMPQKLQGPRTPEIIDREIGMVGRFWREERDLLQEDFQSARGR